MKKLILGVRKGPVIILRLLRAIRMGDMAAIHVMLGEWRQKNPDRRLIIIYNPFDPLHEYSRKIPVEWAYGEFADEIWIKEKDHELIPSCIGEDMCEFFNGKAKNYVHLWGAWKKLMSSRFFIPTIKPTPRIIEAATNVLKKYEVPQRFIVLQVLFDAGYNKYRNAPLEWWVNVAESLVKRGVPVVLLGPTQYMDRMRIPKGVYPVFKDASDPFLSLGITSLSSVHAGGETGLPLWSSIFNIPVVALFREWGHARKDEKTDYRPIAFGAPVVYSPLEKDFEKTAETVAGVFSGAITASTPIN